MTRNRESLVVGRHPDGFLVCPKCGGKLTRPKSSMLRGFYWKCSKADCAGWLPMYPEAVNG